MRPNFTFKTLFLCIFLFTISIAYGQDWANLARYQKENSALTVPSPSENRIVFMGNSITQGWFETHPEFFKQNPFIDRGISGQTTPQMLVRFRQDVISLSPKIVVILAGTNDIAGNTGPSTLEMIMDNLSSMAELAKTNGIKVILCSVLPAFDYPWKPGMEPNIKIPKLNAMIKSYCKKHHFVYLDYFSAMADEKNGMIADLTTDGVHCTLKGYQTMEKLVLGAIKKSLNEGLKK